MPGPGVERDGCSVPGVCRDGFLDDGIGFLLAMSCAPSLGETAGEKKRDGDADHRQERGDPECLLEPIPHRRHQRLVSDAPSSWTGSPSRARDLRASSGR